MNAEGKLYDIIDGPSKSTIFDSCRFVCEKYVDFRVQFGMISREEGSDSESGYVTIPNKDVKIMGIQHEDGSGESFNLEGYCFADLEHNATPNYKMYRFGAYFNTQKRIGTIWFDAVQ